MKEIKDSVDEFNKYAECLKCKRFFDCLTKVGKPDKCVNFEEIKKKER